jgi:D-arginine utilization repressor
MRAPDSRSTSNGPQLASEMRPLIAGIAALLHPFAEVVIHDVERDRIAAIWNPFSGRKVGDRSLLNELADTAPGFGVLGPYEKVGSDGHRITSVSVEADGGSALVCINLDRHPLDSAVELLRSFAVATQPQPPALFERDWRESIAGLVDDWCRQHLRRRDSLNRSERIEIISELDHKGLFATRGAAAHAARSLDISRSALYELLKEARS